METKSYFSEPHLILRAKLLFFIFILFILHPPLYPVHLKDLSLKLILFWWVIAERDSTDVLLAATHVPFHTKAAF